ncbi:MAG: hypothetical protein ACFWTS_08145 [Pseudoclavibacter caeni]|jgi:long-chain alkane monooxygenase
MTRQIHFNAFEMNCVAHQSPGLWRYPGDQAWRYKDIEYWQEIARIAERGRVRCGLHRRCARHL